MDAVVVVGELQPALSSGRQDEERPSRLRRDSLRAPRTIHSVSGAVRGGVGDPTEDRGMLARCGATSPQDMKDRLAREGGVEMRHARAANVRGIQKCRHTYEWPRCA